MNIYVGNFPFDLTEEELREVFAVHGQVASVKIIKDMFSAQNKGFGFVEMHNETEALAAMNAVVEIKGNKIRINEARPQEKRGFIPAQKTKRKKTGNNNRRRGY